MKYGSAGLQMPELPGAAFPTLVSLVLIYLYALLSTNGRRRKGPTHTPFLLETSPFQDHGLGKDVQAELRRRNPLFKVSQKNQMSQPSYYTFYRGSPLSFLSQL